MGRPRKTDLHLPMRVYKHRNAYRYKDKSGQSHFLGNDLSIAMKNLKALQNGIQTGDPYTVSRLYRSAKASAKARGISFSLSKEDIEHVLVRASGRCELTGIHFSNEVVEGARRRPWIQSIDRIDSSVGYERSNIRLICAALNIAINDFGLAVFDKLAKSMRRKSRKIFSTS